MGTTCLRLDRNQSPGLIQRQARLPKRLLSPPARLRVRSRIVSFVERGMIEIRRGRCRTACPECWQAGKSRRETWCRRRECSENCGRQAGAYCGICRVFEGREENQAFRHTHELKPEIFDPVTSALAMPENRITRRESEERKNQMIFLVVLRIACASSEVSLELLSVGEILT